MKISAVIVAAGQSQRFLSRSKELNLNTNHKLLIQWQSKPLFIHTLEALSAFYCFEELVFVCSEEDLSRFGSMIEASGVLPKLCRSFLMAVGGQRRQDSVRNGLLKLNVCDRVAVHDAARPFISKEMLSRIFKAAETSRAVIPALGLTETIKEIDKNGIITKTHNRNQLVRVQTPQIFDFEVLKQAHLQLSGGPQEFTDDAALFEALQMEVQTCRGSEENIKVTYPEDLIQRGLLK